MFNTDFELFQQTPPTPHQAVHRQAPSLDSTLQPSSDTVSVAAFPANNLNSAQTTYSTQRNTVRPARPPVPLFHSNSTGSLPDPNTIQQFQQVTDFTNLTMGGRDINVAYQGTFGDLSSAGDAGLFNMSDNFDFNQLMSSSSAADCMPASDFTAINSGNATGTTVSPKDLFNDSVPPSTSFTNLTTPGSPYLETPDDDYQTSPLFSDNFGDSHGTDNWYPLFNDADTVAAIPSAPSMARTTSASSANQIVVHPGGESLARKRSSTTASPATFSPVVKPSTVAGVNARKRDKPLPPIVVDESDAVALKRARNTAAARKSRAKKVEERDEFLAQIADLRGQIEYWKTLALSNGAKESIED